MHIRPSSRQAPARQRISLGVSVPILRSQSVKISGDVTGLGITQSKLRHCSVLFDALGRHDPANQVLLRIGNFSRDETPFRKQDQWRTHRTVGPLNTRNNVAGTTMKLLDELTPPYDGFS